MKWKDRRRTFNEAKKTTLETRINFEEGEESGKREEGKGEKKENMRKKWIGT